jgi:hypothetical protein
MGAEMSDRNEVSNDIMKYPGQDAPSIGIQQVLYAFHKFIYGARPADAAFDDEMWNALDQAAYNAAASQGLHYRYGEDGRLHVEPYDAMTEAPPE